MPVRRPKSALGRMWGCRGSIARRTTTASCAGTRLRGTPRRYRGASASSMESSMMTHKTPRANAWTASGTTTQTTQTARSASPTCRPPTSPASSTSRDTRSAWPCSRWQSSSSYISRI